MHVGCVLLMTKAFINWLFSIEISFGISVRCSFPSIAFTMPLIWRRWMKLQCIRNIAHRLNLDLDSSTRLELITCSSEMNLFHWKGKCATHVSQQMTKQTEKLLSFHDIWNNNRNGSIWIQSVLFLISKSSTAHKLTLLNKKCTEFALQMSFSHTKSTKIACTNETNANFTCHIIDELHATRVHTAHQK